MWLPLVAKARASDDLTNGFPLFPAKIVTARPLVLSQSRGKKKEIRKGGGRKLPEQEDIDKERKEGRGKRVNK